MTAWPRRLAGLFVLLLSFFLWQYSVDRIFIDLAPTPGSAFVVPLQIGVHYDLHFTAGQFPITRLAFFFKPLQPSLPGDSVGIELFQNDELLATAAVPGSFIDDQGFTSVRLSRAVDGTPDTRLMVRLAVPPSLSGAVGLVQRARDGTFDPDQVSFAIDGVHQNNPLAYQAYFAARPAFAIYLSGLIFLTGLVFLLPRLFTQYLPTVGALAASFIAVAPIYAQGTYPLLLPVAIASVWLGMFWLLHRSNFETIPAIIGANAASLASYFPLHLLQEQPSLVLLASIPLIFALWYRQPAVRWILIGGVCFAALFYLPDSLTVPTGLASLKDTFLDPNQSMAALKIPGSVTPWFHYGSYLGVPAAVLSALGVLAGIRKRSAAVLLLLVTLATLYAGEFALSAWHIPWPYLIVLPTYCLAFFVAAGAQATLNYLRPAVWASVLIIGLGVVHVLDLLYVLGHTLESYYL